MIKMGDKFKEGKTGKVFTVTKVGSDMVILEAEDGSLQSVISQKENQPMNKSDRSEPVEGEPRF